MGQIQGCSLVDAPHAEDEDHVYDQAHCHADVCAPECAQVHVDLAAHWCSVQDSTKSEAGSAA